MIPSPIPRVLSTLSTVGVRALLMGGQACILYGAAEFSRDVDVAVAADARSLGRLRRALKILDAEPVYFPRLSAEALRRGHACHFRCRADGLENMRLDVMSVMRGVGSFASLWKRRVEMALSGGARAVLLSLPDLVAAKKTQRDKDWPMIRRLVEADVAAAPRAPGAKRIDFWLRECRTPGLLTEIARKYPRNAARISRSRPAVSAAIRGPAERIREELDLEERSERARDEEYWAPLKAELEKLRLRRPRVTSKDKKARE